MKRWTTVPHENWSRAHELRRALTPAEQVLWSALMGKQLGVKFRCQHPIGPYIVDFYADELRLVIELDGEIHALEEVKARDAEREAYLKSRQRVVVRFTNREVLETPEKVLDEIRKIITQLKPELPPGPP
ncbi:endonuclease domain-containing protein [candidate division KSB1 bacterium]|nr:endonuclease domain-containing protein [candidate division KSB1 bacterium]